ncbi:MAG: hypothetical protein WCQ57_16690, partial [Verrucomicrobiota bacterium]
SFKLRANAPEGRKRFPISRTGLWITVASSTGQLLDASRGKPVTWLMFNVPHAHDGFKSLTPPRIQMAQSL